MSATLGWRILALVLYSLLLVGLGVRIGIDRERSKQLDKLQEEVVQGAKNSKVSADATRAAQAAGGKAEVINEGKTHEAKERVRVIYRVPDVVAADCRQPDGVLREIRAANERANGAVRAAAGAPDPAVSGRRQLPRDGRAEARLLLRAGSDVGDRDE